MGSLQKVTFLRLRESILPECNPSFPMMKKGFTKTGLFPFVPGGEVSFKLHIFESDVVHSILDGKYYYVHN